MTDLEFREMFARYMLIKTADRQTYKTIKEFREQNEFLKMETPQYIQLRLNDLVNEHRFEENFTNNGPAWRRKIQ